MGSLIGHFEGHAHARRSTPFHRLDARVKLLLLVAYTVAVVTTPISCGPAFAVYGALLAGAAGAGRFPLGYLCRRMAVVLPFILFAAVFIPFHTVPPAMAGNGALPAGWMLFLNFAVKSALGAGATVMVTASTPFPRLVDGFERLRVPRVVVMIFSFTHRYLFVLVEEIQRMKRARDSRCYRGQWLGDVPVIGRMIGTLFLRSYERGERVYLAMLSRGFEGTRAPHETAPPLAAPDLALLSAVSLLLAAVWAAAHFHLLP